MLRHPSQDVDSAAPRRRLRPLLLGDFDEPDPTLGRASDICKAACGELCGESARNAVIPVYNDCGEPPWTTRCERKKASLIWAFYRAIAVEEDPIEVRIEGLPTSARLCTDRHARHGAELHSAA